MKYASMFCIKRPDLWILSDGVESVCHDDVNVFLHLVAEPADGGEIIVQQVLIRRRQPTKLVKVQQQVVPEDKKNVKLPAFVNRSFCYLEFSNSDSAWWASSSCPDSIRISACFPLSGTVNKCFKLSVAVPSCVAKVQRFTLYNSRSSSETLLST